MKYLSIQDIDIPLPYVTAFSYSKVARVVQNHLGYARFRGYEPAEISVRIYISPAISMYSGTEYMDEINKYIDLQVDKESMATPVMLGGFPIYPSLKFKITSINKTVSADRNGFVESLELDLILSGVECVKEMARKRTLAVDEIDELPEVDISCNGKHYSIGSESTISEITIQPYSAVVEIILGTDSDIVNETAWLKTPAENHAVFKIKGFHEFNIVKVDLVYGILRLTGSVFDNSMAKNITKTYLDSNLFDILSDMPCGLKVSVNEPVEYFLANGTNLDVLRQLQKSAGFLVDVKENSISVVDVPSSLESSVDLMLNVEEDLMTEPIDCVIWRDGIHEFTAGKTGTVLNVKSSFSSNSDIMAQNCLKFANYSQNSISITAPYDDRIRHHSVINLQKGSDVICAMVENFVFDLILNEMSLELHYISR